MRRRNFAGRSARRRARSRTVERHREPRPDPRRQRCHGEIHQRMPAPPPPPPPRRLSRIPSARRVPATVPGAIRPPPPLLGPPGPVSAPPGPVFPAPRAMLSARTRVTPVPRFAPIAAVPRVAVATLRVGTLFGTTRLIGELTEGAGVRPTGIRRKVRAARGYLVSPSWVARRPGTDVVVRPSPVVPAAALVLAHHPRPRPEPGYVPLDDLGSRPAPARAPIRAARSQWLALTTASIR